MKKTLNPKSFPAWMAVGEQPNRDMRGVMKQAAQLKDKFRSPFGFCGPKRVKA